MAKSKIVTICGSMRFAKEQMKIATKLEIEDNYVVIQCIYDAPTTGDEGEIIDRLHKQKIDISDAIYVVNIGGYIGTSTRNEIEYAKAHGKEIIYHEPQ